MEGYFLDVIIVATSLRSRSTFALNLHLRVANDAFRPQMRRWLCIELAGRS